MADAIGSRIAEELAEKLAYHAAQQEATDPANQDAVAAFENQMDAGAAQDVQDVGEADQLPGGPASLQLGEPVGQTSSLMNDFVQGLSSAAESYNEMQAQIDAQFQNMAHSGGTLSTSELMQMQHLTMNFNTITTAASNMANQVATGLKSLFQAQ